MNHLAGLRVIVTRPTHQAIPLGRTIASLGGSWESVPLIQVRLTVGPDVLEKVQQLPTYDYWVATSANGIRGLADACHQLGVVPQTMPWGYVVGKGTAAEARASGFQVETFPTVRNADDLGRALVAHWSNPKRVLCIQGNRSLASLREILSENGCSVEPCTVYQTEELSVDDVRVERWCIGEQAHNTAFVFYSPSAAAALVKCSRRWLTVPPRKALVVCVGATTADWCLAHGVPVDGVASEPNDEGVCRALAELWTLRQSAL